MGEFMKGIFLIFLMAAGCALFEKRIEVSNKPQFMSSAEIAEQMSQVTKSVGQTEWTADELQRIKDMPALTDLVTKEEMLFKASKTLYKAVGSADLRKWAGEGIDSQYGPYCTAYATMNAYQILGEKAGQVGSKYSQRYFFEGCYGTYSLQAAMNASTKCPVPPYACYQTNGVRDCDARMNAKTKSTGFVNLGSNLDLWKSYLDRSLPVVMAAAMDKDWAQCKAVIRGSSAAVRGSGHAVAIVGYSDAGRYFIIENSWGPGCGDKGYQYYSYDIFNRTDLYQTGYVVAGIENANRIVCRTDKVCKFKNWWRTSKNDEECTKCVEVK